MSDEKLYRVECVCSNMVEGNKCGEHLMESNEKPHMTAKELRSRWSLMVMSAPLQAPRCPKCEYSTGSDYNAGTDFLIDDGETKLTSEEWFKKQRELHD